MNKKQLIISWIIVIWVVIICLNPAKYYVGTGFPRSSRTDFAKTLFNILAVLTPGGLLIYMTRNKK